MISLSKDIHAALKNRQRGFLLNPYRFSAGGGGSTVTATNVVALTKSGDAHGTGAFTTASFTPGTGRRLVVRLFAMSNSNDALAGTDLTITDSMGPLTWTVAKQTTSAESIGWGYAMSMWISSATSSGASMTLTFDAGTFNVQNYIYQVDYLSNENASPIGATAMGTDADGDAAASITLDATPATTSLVLAQCFVAQDNTVGDVTFGTGWTEEGDVARAGWFNAQTQKRSGSTSTTVGWDDLNNGGSTPLGAAMIAVEFKAA